MIEIKNLTKIYTSKNAKECVALDNVSFSLPDKGMVFVLGKSGSGKSTFLNMLSGLDKMTSGDIIADGNKFSTFTENDYDNYRNSYLGFIFQDFCLIDKMTIYKNVEMALSLQNVKNKDIVNEMIEKVGLKGFENRYPKELSGGQQQRVAIARALVKSPKLILADEPTGNLDSKTSKQILELFKKLSKDNLIVIVSHNIDDADTYADQIIRLNDGKVVENIVKNKKYKNEFKIDGENVYLPDRKLEQGELEQLNEKIADGKTVLHTTIDKFKQAPKHYPDTKKESLTKAKMPFSYMAKLSYDFLRKKKFGLIFTVIMVSIIISLLGICQMLSTFNGDDLIDKNLSSSTEKVFVMKKGYDRSDVFRLMTNRNCAISEQEIQHFRNNGYQGNILKLYSVSLPLEHQNSRNDTFSYMSDKDRYANVYASEGIGVLQCSEEYLKSIFGNENGEIEIAEGSFDASSNKIIVTDFFADSFLYFNKEIENIGTIEKPYVNIVNKLLKNRYCISAVIKTDYKEKYSDLIERFNKYRVDKKFTNEFKDLLLSEEYSDFIEKLNIYYNVAYTINPDFLNAEIHSAEQENGKVSFPIFGSIQYKNLENEDVETKNETHIITIDKKLGYNLNHGEAIVTPAIYNKLFGTNYTIADCLTAPQQKVKITHYNNDYANVDSAPVYTKEFTILGIAPIKNADTWFVDSSDYYEMAPHSTVVSSLYFENTENVSNIYKAGTEQKFVVNSNYFLAINEVTGVINIFTKYFTIFSYILFFAVILLLVNYGLSSVKNNVYEIGVVRALGCKNKNVGLSFFLQILFVGIMISVLSSLTMLAFVYLLNNVLVTSIVNFYHLQSLAKITVLAFVPKIYVLNIFATLLITLLSTLIPILKLRKLKPVNIIKSKE